MIQDGDLDNFLTNEKESNENSNSKAYGNRLNNNLNFNNNNRSNNFSSNNLISSTEPNKMKFNSNLGKKKNKNNKRYDN